MSRLVNPVRLRLLILTSLIIVTAYTAMPQQAASACITCVQLTGGLCVGCDPNVTTGFKWCWPVQEDCSCEAWVRCGVGLD
jgi:hypothetical protein